MNTKEFIENRRDLVWYVKNPKELSDDAIVEAVLNYGEWEDVKKIIEILGEEKTAEIFKKNSSKKRSNYNKKTKHYFDLYFKKYA